MAASAHRDFPDLIPPSTRVRTVNQALHGDRKRGAPGRSESPCVGFVRRGLFDTGAVLDLGPRCPHPAHLRGPAGCIKPYFPMAFGIVRKLLIYPSADLSAENESVERPPRHQYPPRP